MESKTHFFFFLSPRYPSTRDSDSDVFVHKHGRLIYI
jgi:hypothetical protein